MPTNNTTSINALDTQEESEFKQSGLFLLVCQYCKIITAEHLSDLDSRQEAEILNFAVYDEKLAHWLERAEFYLSYEEERGNTPTFDVVLSHLFLDRLICIVKQASPESITAQEFKELVSDFRFEPGFIEREINFQEGDTTFKAHLVKQPPLYIYASCWLPGQQVDLHHHGEKALDVLKVFQGTLVHEFLSDLENPDLPMQARKANSFKEDSLIVIDKSCYHRLGNLSDRPLVTLTFRLNLDPRVNEASPISLSHPVVTEREIVSLCAPGSAGCKLLLPKNKVTEL